MRDRRVMTGWIVPMLLLLGVGVLGAIRGARHGGDIAWAANFETGQEQAKQSQKPLLISFHMPGCGWCRKLDAETFTDSRVLKLSRRFVWVRADSDVDAALIRKFQVMEFPMTLLLDSNGKEITRFSGYVPPDRFAKALEILSNETGQSQP